MASTQSCGDDLQGTKSAGQPSLWSVSRGGLGVAGGDQSVEGRPPFDTRSPHQTGFRSEQPSKLASTML